MRLASCNPFNRANTESPLHYSSGPLNTWVSNVFALPQAIEGQVMEEELDKAVSPKVLGVRCATVVSLWRPPFATTHHET